MLMSFNLPNLIDILTFIIVQHHPLLDFLLLIFIFPFNLLNITQALNDISHNTLPTVLILIPEYDIGSVVFIFKSRGIILNLNLYDCPTPIPIGVNVIAHILFINQSLKLSVLGFEG